MREGLAARDWLCYMGGDDVSSSQLFCFTSRNFDISIARYETMLFDVTKIANTVTEERASGCSLVDDMAKYISANLLWCLF